MMGIKTHESGQPEGWIFYIPFKQGVGVRPVWGLCFGLKVAAGQNDIIGGIEIMDDIYSWCV